jgi:hypothetical protein
MVKPFLKRFDDITGGTLLPGLGAGQAALVLDAKWTSRHWFPPLDQNGKALPFIEIGVVRTVRDSAKVLAAFKDYRTLVNDVLAKAGEFNAPVPPGGVPKAQEAKAGPGTAYFWPVPAHGQDEQIQPNVALSSAAAAFSLSVKHGERLLTPTPLAAGSRPPAAPQPLLRAAVVDFAGLVGAARPWVEQLAVPAAVAQIPDNAPPGLTRGEVPAQVRTVLDVLQCLRRYASATYRDGDATVTHSETVYEDLK